MARILVTRPREDAEGVTAELRARGHDVVVEPLLEIVPVPGAAVDATATQGILVTSANGIRALAPRLERRDLPVWAVGDASARAARELGFARVESAGGDVESLAALVSAQADPAGGELLHAAGTVTAGDLAGRLGEAGFAVRRLVLYEARTAQAVSPSLARALADRMVDAGLFFSPRTAATFVRLVSSAGLDDACAPVAAYALSPAVARELASLPWRTVRTAAAPTQAALLAALDEDLKR